MAGSTLLLDRHSLAVLVVEEADAVSLEAIHDVIDCPVDGPTFAMLKPDQGSASDAAARRRLLQRPSEQRPRRTKLSRAYCLNCSSGRFHFCIVAHPARPSTCPSSSVPRKTINISAEGLKALDRSPTCWPPVEPATSPLACRYMPHDAISDSTPHMALHVREHPIAIQSYQPRPAVAGCLRPAPHHFGASTPTPCS